VEFRAHLPSGRLESLNLNTHDEAWLILKPQSCHLIRMTRMRASQRLFVFICNRNTSRSPMAAAICNAEIARRLRVPHAALHSIGIRAVSAGLCATADDPMTTEVQQALQCLRVPAPPHSAQNLTPELAAQAEFIFCMTESQRQAVIKGFPEWASKTFCLQPGMDLEDPHGRSAEGFVQLGEKVQQLVQPLVDRLVAPAEEPESA
jgi:protein-tyrosine-phosphatase